MRFVIEGRLRPSCGLTPARYFDLAVQEWEMVLGWVASGVAIAYGRPVSVPGGILLVDVASEADPARSRRRCPWPPTPMSRSVGRTCPPFRGRLIPGRRAPRSDARPG